MSNMGSLSEKLEKIVNGDYCAYMRYVHHHGAGETTIHLCDSDAPGAFRVYREWVLHTFAATIAEHEAQPTPDEAAIRADERKKVVEEWEKIAVDCGISSYSAHNIGKRLNPPPAPKERVEVVSDTCGGWLIFLDDLIKETKAMRNDAESYAEGLRTGLAASKEQP